MHDTQVSRHLGGFGNKYRRRTFQSVFVIVDLSELYLIGLPALLCSGSGKGTSPVVRERVMDVLAAAAYASSSSEYSFTSPLLCPSTLLAFTVQPRAVHLSYQRILGGVCLP